MTEGEIERRCMELYDDCEHVLRIDLCRRVARLESLCGDMYGRLQTAESVTEMGWTDARLRSELRLMGVIE